MKKYFWIALLFGFSAMTAFSARVPMADIIQRANAKTYPAFFQMWEGKILNRPDRDSLANLTSHGLTSQGPYFYGLEWDLTGGIKEGDAVKSGDSS